MPSPAGHNQTGEYRCVLDDLAKDLSDSEFRSAYAWAALSIAVIDPAGQMRARLRADAESEDLACAGRVRGPVVD